MENKDYFRLERKTAGDFPFYNYTPKHIGIGGWLIIIAFLAIGFVALSQIQMPFLPKYLDIIAVSATLPFFALIGLCLVMKSDFKTLFRRIHLKDIFVIVVLVILTIVLDNALGSLVSMFEQTASNPAGISNTGDSAITKFIILRIGEVFQLFGEEFLAIIPFILLMQICYNNFHLSRKKSIIIALIVSSLIFGLLHLPTYDWNILQCILLIGVSRIGLTLAYLITKNIWISYIVHFLYDSILFSLTFFV